MISNKERLFDFDAELKHETDKAFLVIYEGEGYWLPKSMTEDNGDGSFTIPYFLAYDKGMI
jgi:hypothetical protein